LLKSWFYYLWRAILKILDWKKLSELYWIKYNWLNQCTSRKRQIWVFFSSFLKKIRLLLCILMYFQNYSNWSDVLEQYFTYCSYGNVLNRKFENEKKRRRYLNGLEALFCFGKSTGVGEGNVIIILWEPCNNLNSIEMHSILC
jgi:hypothetical protein